MYDHDDEVDQRDLRILTQEAKIDELVKDLWRETTKSEPFFV